MTTDKPNRDQKDAPPRKERDTLLPAGPPKPRDDSAATKKDRSQTDKRKRPKAPTSPDPALPYPTNEL